MHYFISHFGEHEITGIGPLGFNTENEINQAAQFAYTNHGRLTGIKVTPQFAKRHKIRWV